METQILTTMLNLLKEAMEWLQNLYEAARKGGLPPFSLTPEKATIDLTTAHRNGSGRLDDETLRQEYRKMLTRNRVRRWRERQKRKQALAVTGNANGAANTENSVTSNAKNVTCNAESSRRLPIS